jgi:hypothetical protein
MFSWFVFLMVNNICVRLFGKDIKDNTNIKNIFQKRSDFFEDLVVLIA